MIKNKSDIKKQEIDLSGPEGNSFVLLSYAKSFSKQLGLNFEEIAKEMKSSNYENLITVFDKYFGEFVDLVK